jgi:hypothetical protein
MILCATTVITALGIASTFTVNAARNARLTWKSSFGLEDSNFASTGSNAYFILEPGSQLVLENKKAPGLEQLQLFIIVTNDTKTVNGIQTRKEKLRTENLLKYRKIISLYIDRLMTFITLESKVMNTTMKVKSWVTKELGRPELRGPGPE